MKRDQSFVVEVVRRPRAAPAGQVVFPQRSLVPPAAVPAVAMPAPAWRPGRTVAELQDQARELMLEVPPVLLGPVLPLAIGARDVFVVVAKPGCKTRIRRWLGAWSKTDAYLGALAEPGSQRPDRHGRKVEPVAEKHRAHAAAVLQGRAGR
jgi:hypothetical protein